MMSLPRPTRRRRGNLLMIAIALVVIMGILVSALHHYEVVTRRAISGAEADILLVQARKWELGRALNKIPAYMKKPSGIIVSSGASALDNKIYVSDNCGAAMFSRDGDGAWNGLPNLIVKRAYQLDPNSPPLAAPPNFKEYRGTPRSPNASYQVYNGRNYRQMTGDFLDVGAFAPAGSVRLDGCSGWANPDMDDVGAVKARDRFSGIPVVIAAGTTAQVGNLTYGKVYAVQSIELSNPGMVTPLVGPLPYSTTRRPDAVMLEQINAALGNLTQTAELLDNKTLQISGEPPTISNILTLIFTDAIGGNGDAVRTKMLGWLSIRSAVEFPFVSLPGFAVTSFPMTYVCFQVWFHGPFPPDTEGAMGSPGQTPSQAAQDLGRKLDQLQKARASTNYLLIQIQGGNPISNTPGIDVGQKGRPIYEPSGGYDKDGNPIGEWRPVGSQTGNVTVPPSQVNPGLKPRTSALLENLQADYTTLEKAKTEGGTALVSDGLKTNQSLLAWMADYQGYLYDDTGKVPETGVSGNLGSGIDSLDYSLKATPPSVDQDVYRNDVAYPMFNTGILTQSKAVFPPTKDRQGKVVTYNGVAVRDTSKAPTQYFGAVSLPSNLLKSDQAVTPGQWRTILDASAGDQKMGDLDRQLELFRFLTSSSDTNNPFNKIKALETKLIEHLAAIDKIKSQVQTAINVARAALPKVAAKMSNVPQTRKAEREEAKYKTGLYSEFQKGKGIQGFSYLRYGFSFDVLYNVISYLADSSGNQDQFWTGYCPLVWWGVNDNDVPIQTNGALDVKAAFTVPQTRTFFYEKPVTIRGDLWLQRGSTMVVRGDLKVNSPQNAVVGAATKYIQALDFLPSGRIFLEEGASLIVLNGNLYCQGPVVVTGQPYAIRPISSAIMVPNGDLVLRHGIYSGVGLTDILQSPDLNQKLGIGNDVNKYFVYPLLATVFPNMGKVYPLGPFHRRLCYFAKNCTQYQMEIFIGPFGIPIPLINPWPVPRQNVNVTLYRGLSLFYAIACNINLGENLYLQSDWWPFRHIASVGVVPIFPKLDPKAFGFDIGLKKFVDEIKKISFPGPDQFKEFFTSGLARFDPTRSDSLFRVVTDKLLTQMLTQALTDMIPSPYNLAISPLIGAILPNDDSEADKPSGPYAGITGNIGGPFDDLKATFHQVTSLVSTTKEAFENALMHEVTGTLVYGRNVYVGYNPPGALSGGVLKALDADYRPLLASGLFLASGDININSDYTVGAIMTSAGSINKDTASHTNLLFYPAFTRASLYQPGQTPKITTQLSSQAGFPQFLARALDVEYGVMQSAGAGQKGLDIYVANPHLTAEGWEK